MGFYDALAMEIERAGINQLDGMAGHVCRALGEGILADDKAQQLFEQIQQRRPVTRGLVSMMVAAPPRYFIQRSPDQRSRDRWASIQRRRIHAGTALLPPSLAGNFPTGKTAVLRVVADEWLAHGVCIRSHNEMAARAGVCKSWAKEAIKDATKAGLISVLRRRRPGRKNLTNVIRIIRADWIDWLHKGGRKAYAIKVCNRAKPDFGQGALKNPPRSQTFRNGSDDCVDKVEEKKIRTFAGRYGP